MAKQVADYDRLCAWLGEAVKAKSELMKMSEALTRADFPEEAPEEVPMAPTLTEYAASKGITLQAPEKKEYTEEDVKSEFTVKELAEYFGCNSESAVYGNLVHKNGVISNARVEVLKAISAPFVVTEDLIKSYAPTVDVTVVDEIFTELQGLQRSYNAQHNSYESRVKQRLAELQQEASAEYLKAHQEYTNLRRTLQRERDTEYQSKVEEYNAESKKYIEAFNTWKQQQIAEAASLKIVIPEALNPLFTQLDTELKG